MFVRGVTLMSGRAAPAPSLIQNLAREKQPVGSAGTDCTLRRPRPPRSCAPAATETTETCEGSADLPRSADPSRGSPKAPRLEDELHAQLHTARAVLLVRRRNLAEVGRRLRDDRRGEVRLVEGVERLEPELNPHPLTQLDVLEQRQVDVLDVVAADGVQAVRERAQVGDRR